MWSTWKDSVLLCVVSLESSYSKKEARETAHNKNSQHNMAAKTFFECRRDLLEQKKGSVVSVAGVYIAVSRQYHTLGPVRIPTIQKRC